MATARTAIAPPNSVLIVGDPAIGVIPASYEGQPVEAFETAIAVGTLMEFDGETEVQLASALDGDPPPIHVKRWQGPLRTAGEIGVTTVGGDVLLRVPAARQSVVSIWTNDPTEPDSVWVKVLTPPES